MEARGAHYPEVAGSSPARAITVVMLQTQTQKERGKHMEIKITINNNEEKGTQCANVSVNETQPQERTEEKAEKRQTHISLEELIGKSYRTILYLSDASKRELVTKDEVVEILNVLGDIQRRLHRIHNEERV